MAKLDQQTAVSAVMIQHLIADWCHQLDAKNCTDVSMLCTEDCVYMLAGKPHQGHAAIEAFYAARNERVRTQQKDGIRTQRHTVSNFRFDFRSDDDASVAYTLVNYSAEGPAPAPNLVGPTIIADVVMDVRRGVDGAWLIARFDSRPIFIGNDPFLNASTVPKA